VSVARLNPRQVRDFAKATAALAKTDSIDARVIAHFAEAIKGEPQAVPDQQSRNLSALLARRSQLVDMITAEKNRLNTADDAGPDRAARCGKRSARQAERPCVYGPGRSKCHARSGASRLLSRGL
jgi:transposase